MYKYKFKKEHLILAVVLAFLVYMIYNVIKTRKDHFSLSLGKDCKKVRFLDELPCNESMYDEPKIRPGYSEPGIITRKRQQREPRFEELPHY